MMIDFRKLVIQLLPPTLRRVIFASWVHTLITQIAVLYDRHREGISDLRIKSACTPQSVWLERIVKHETGVEVKIEEYNHKPYDFIVKLVRQTASNDPLNQVGAVINRYKLAGKSYTFEETVMIYRYEFSGWICRKKPALRVVEFGGWICVQEAPVRKGVGVSTYLNMTESNYYINVIGVELDEDIRITVRVGSTGIGVNVYLSPRVTSAYNNLLGSKDSLGDNPSAEYSIRIYGDGGSDITDQYHISNN